jgi:hypothetical protein
VPITAWRNARYIEEFPFTVDGVAFDFTSWSGAMQVRLYGAAAGDPLITLTSQATDAEGVWIIEPSQGIVRVRIDEETLTALWTSLGGPTEAGDPIVLSYDLVLTPPGGGDEVWAYGTFTIQPGVTS